MRIQNLLWFWRDILCCWPFYTNFNLRFNYKSFKTLGVYGLKWAHAMKIYVYELKLAPHPWLINWGLLFTEAILHKIHVRPSYLLRPFSAKSFSERPFSEKFFYPQICKSFNWNAKSRKATYDCVYFNLVRFECFTVLELFNSLCLKHMFICVLDERVSRSCLSSTSTRPSFSPQGRLSREKPLHTNSQCG